ncbi:MAG: DUF6506 family protein [Candidatus Aenigmatarchaeota archaeon]
MKFKTLFVAHVPDADPNEHRNVLETDLYKLYTCLVKDQKEALEICKEHAGEESIHSILLCPGFTNEDVAEISREVGEEVGVSVARGDGPSGRIAKEAMAKADWF